MFTDSLPKKDLFVLTRKQNLAVILSWCSDSCHGDSRGSIWEGGVCNVCLCLKTSDWQTRADDYVKWLNETLLIPDYCSGNSCRGGERRKDWPDQSGGLRWRRPRLHGSPGSARRFIPSLCRTPWASSCSRHKLSLCVLSAFSLLMNPLTSTECR